MSNNYSLNSSSFSNASLTTVVSITLVLFLLGLTILVGFMGRGISSFMKENLGVTVVIADNTSQSDIAAFQKQLDNSRFVKSATYITKDEIKKQLTADLGKDPEDLLGYNPLSSCFDVKLKSIYANSDSIKVVEKAMKGKQLVKNFIYSKSDLDMVNSNLSKIGTLLLVIAALLAFISFTLIRNTIRLNIYSKRFLINTMQLVGATNGFVRRPFVVRTVFLGILAAILADIAITALLYSVTKAYPELLSILKMPDLIIVYLSIIILGILLSALATISAVNRYLKMETNTLYHI